MTDSPPASDLPWFREQFAAKAGVPLADVGMLPDQSHLDGGGYHCGSADIKAIDKYHGPASAHVGSSTEDYSARQLKDRQYVEFELSHGSNFASAVDTPDGWGHGGNAAWIRWNNYVVADLRADPNRIPGLRGINFTPDGATKKRYDTNNPSQGIIPSTDTVLWHTHFEWWRWSVLMRMAGFHRLLDLMDDAIANRPARAFTISVAAPAKRGNEAMVFTVTNVPAGAVDCVGNGVINKSRCLATPRGPWVIQYDEVINWYNANGGDAATITLTWDRMLSHCSVLAQQPIDLEAFAVALAPKLVSATDTAAVVAAMTSPEGQLALVNASTQGIKNL